MTSTDLPSKFYLTYVYIGNTAYAVMMDSPTDPEGFIEGVGKQFLDSWQWVDASTARVSGTGYSVGVSPGWVDDTIQRQAKKDPIDLYLKTDGGKADAIVVYRYDVAGEVSVAFSAYITRQWEDLGATVTPEGFEDIDGEESAVLWREGGPDPNGKYLSYAVCSDVACYLVVIFTNLDYQAAHAQVGRPFLDTWAWDEPTA